MRARSRSPVEGCRVRYAEDIVVGFEHKADAHRVLEMTRARLEGFAPTLHPETTRLIEFGRRVAAGREKRGLGRPETFNFPGFTMICGKSRRAKFLLCGNPGAIG
jgi:RNA-directed DNA polymerase